VVLNSLPVVLAKLCGGRTMTDETRSLLAEVISRIWRRSAVVFIVALAVVLLVQPPRRCPEGRRPLTISCLMSLVFMAVLLSAAFRGLVDFLDSGAVPWAVITPLFLCISAIWAFALVRWARRSKGA
jgi:hypothetical protein